MGMIVSPALFAPPPGVGGSTQPGALVARLLTDDNTDTGALEWDTEVYDRGNYFTAAANTVLTMPATGLYRLVSQRVGNADSGYVVQSVTGTPNGIGASRNSTTNAFTADNVVSGILSLSAGNTAALSRGGITDAWDAGNATWHSVEPIDATIKYCRVSKSANQTISVTTAVPLTWDNEVADVGGWHDNVTNNSRLTVPSGVSLIRLSASVATGINSGSFTAYFTKNGAAAIAVGLPIKKSAINSNRHKTLVSAPLEVTPGDYFQLIGQFSSQPRDVNADVRSWFQIEEVPSTYKRALVFNSAAQALTANVSSILNWDSETYDTDNIHSTVTNPSRLTVPAGMTQARISFGLFRSNNAGNIQAWVTKNGAVFPGMPYESSQESGEDYCGAMSTWVDVVPGDYFQAVLFPGATDGGTALAVSWFAIECR